MPWARRRRLGMAYQSRLSSFLSGAVMIMPKSPAFMYERVSSDCAADSLVTCCPTPLTLTDNIKGGEEEMDRNNIPMAS